MSTLCGLEGRLLIANRVEHRTTSLSPLLDTSLRVGDDKIHDFPLTGEQLEERIEEFINSISEDTVCRSASRHYGQTPCRVVRRDRGSFNICFFVLFDVDNITWVMRIPLEPLIPDAWNKVQSEVATTRYIGHNTTIPIPRVHAYGRDSDLVQAGSITVPFLVGDYIPAQSCYQRQRDRSVFCSEEQCLAYQHHILSEIYRLPIKDSSIDPVQMELFALESLREHVFGSFEFPRCMAPFVLSHQDFRCSNIIVTEDLRVCGIIDWELTGTIPRHLFTPPWITSHDLIAVGACPVAAAAITPSEIYPEFLRVLDARSATSNGCAKLRDSWKHQPEIKLPVAQILRHPSYLIRVYYKFIFPQLFRDDGGALALEVKHRVEQSECYTQCLKDRGLLVRDERSQALQELFAKAE
ncbi:phosphotransferase enzyme family protein [Dactylonectria macrodidyma]|uniref:Phosphotransferase enzyme family protein n=1 Tax=Dactylonectria macrodidyma TaxID=307937 RepID=A0A9P9FTY2_9HYPO|nr:phosphotransferase enzyme family protein [Dactylonectria macrodidyma]